MGTKHFHSSHYLPPIRNRNKAKSVKVNLQTWFRPPKALDYQTKTKIDRGQVTYFVRVSTKWQNHCAMADVIIIDAVIR